MVKEQKPDFEKEIKVIATLLAILVSILAILEFFGISEFSRIFQGQSPRFQFQYEGIAESEDVTYEVAEELRHAENRLGEFDITIRSDNAGNDLWGTVDVVVRRPDGSEAKTLEWQRFEETFNQPQTLSLKPTDLFTFSLLPADASRLNPEADDPLTRVSSYFDIEIMHDTDKLAKARVNVINTPWYHSTRISRGAIQMGENITAYVKITNLGKTSRFYLGGGLYDISKTSANSLAMEQDVGWWPAKSWESVDWPLGDESGAPLITDPIAKYDSIALRFEVPGDLFEERKTYVLETYAAKRLKYVDYPDGEWFTSDQRWRTRDLPQYSTIVVLAP